MTSRAKRVDASTRAAPDAREIGAFKTNDGLKSGVFVLKSARAAPRGDEASRLNAFEPVLRDETRGARERRAAACARAWEALDGHCQRVADEANAEAFARVRRFVREQGATRVERARETEEKNNGGDRRVPVGVVLAGGVNSDDHEETFAALTKSLRKSGDAHVALLRSRDLKARAGAGTGGLGVAFGVIMRQLDRTGGHWGGKSMRALRRWHEETSGARRDGLIAASTVPSPIGNALTVYNGGDSRASGEGDDVRARGGKKRAATDSRATSPARRSKRRARDDVERAGDDERTLYPVIQGRNCPVVIVVEDTESFDVRVLDSFIRSVSEFVSSVPVVVLLGLATSVSSLQGMLPAATASLMNAQAFQLWAPGQMMEAVQERVLLSPERVPAFGSEVLNVLHTRFKEHDFSLAAVRRALHLLTITHFMTEPLSAVLPLIAKDSSEPCADGDDSDDEYGDAIDQFVRDLDPNAVEYARIKHGFGAKSMRDGDGDSASSTTHTKSELSAALKDVYRLRRRWALSLRCIQVACAATEKKFKKSVTTMADLLLDASRKGYFGGAGEFNPKSQGGTLLNVAFSRIRDEFTTAEIGDLVKSMLKFLDDDEVMRSAEGSELRFLLSNIEDGSFDAEDARRREAAILASTPTNEGGDERRGLVIAASNANATAEKLAHDETNAEDQRLAMEAILNARKRRGNGAAFATSLTPAPRTSTRDEDAAANDGLVLPKSPPRGRSAPARSEANALALVTTTVATAAKPERPRLDSAKSAAANEFCDILRAIARKYGSHPPESIDASGIFVVTDVECVRAALQASPRLSLENTLTDPSELLRCACCRHDDYALANGRRVPETLPDTAAAYRLLARFGERAPIYDWFQSFCESKAGSEMKRGDAAAAARGKGTFGLPREKLWQLQARFTRAVAELEFLGIARPYQKGRKGVEYMVRTAFPLDKLARDSRSNVVERLAIQPA